MPDMSARLIKIAHGTKLRNQSCRSLTWAKNESKMTVIKDLDDVPPNTSGYLTMAYRNP
jgi:hypothetical protein